MFLGLYFYIQDFEHLSYLGKTKQYSVPLRLLIVIIQLSNRSFSLTEKSEDFYRDYVLPPTYKGERTNSHAVS